MKNRVDFAENEKNAKTEPFYQWDYGQELEIHGLNLPDEIEVHFQYFHTGLAIKKLGTTVDGVTVVEIPNKLFERHLDITAYIYYKDDTGGKTLNTIVIPVFARAKPDTWDENHGSDEACIQQMLTSIKESIPTKLSELEKDVDFGVTDYSELTNTPTKLSQFECDIDIGDSIETLVGTWENPIYTTDLKEHTPYFMRGVVALDAEHKDSAVILDNTDNTNWYVCAYKVIDPWMGGGVEIRGAFGKLTFRYSGVVYHDLYMRGTDVPIISMYGTAILEEMAVRSSHRAYYLNAGIRRVTGGTYKSFTGYLIPFDYDGEMARYLVMEQSSGKLYVGTYIKANTVTPDSPTYPFDSIEYLTTEKDGGKSMILNSSTEGSSKQFKITVDDTGTLSATEVV